MIAQNIDRLEQRRHQSPQHPYHGPFLDHKVEAVALEWKVKHVSHHHIHTFRKQKAISHSNGQTLAVTNMQKVHSRPNW